MLETTIIRASAYYEENIESIKTVKRLAAVSKEIEIGGKIYQCVPNTSLLAKKMEVEESVLRRDMTNLVRLGWARRYCEGKKSLYAIGTAKRYFLDMEVERLFRRARRTKSGAMQQTEYRWIPLDQWTGLTLWTYLSARFREEKNIWPRYADARGRVQMQRIVGKVGIRRAKAVADFLVENWEKLKTHFKWYGNPNCGLFEGFFWKLADFKDQGIPTYQHDRKHDDTPSGDSDWKEFDGN